MTFKFFGLSPSDVSSVISTCAVVELENFPMDAKVVVVASVGVFRWIEEFLTRMLFIDGIKVGLTSVTKGNKEIAKFYFSIS